MDQIETATATYGLIARRNSFTPTPLEDKEILCAWCYKSLKEIGRKNINIHCKNHMEWTCKKHNVMGTGRRYCPICHLGK